MPAVPTKRYLVQTFGCQMNVHDSRRIDEVLWAAGYAPAEEPALADLIVFNTCSVREKAEHKLMSALGRLRPLKAQRRDLVVAVAGCVAQQEGENLLRKTSLIDVVIGPDNIVELPGLVRDIQLGGPPMARTVFDHEAPQFLEARARRDAPEVSAYVTVMKGCDERCSYCIVPYTRGSERYRAGDAIVGEVRALVEGGVREVTLLGQTVNSWFEPGQAADPAADPDVDSGLSQFAELLRRLAREVPELDRLRYTSPHPRHVTPALVRAHAELDVLPAHVHLPVQSGSDRLLKRMIRRYRRADYLAAAGALVRARPGLTLSTDIIVGFPGETEADFQETLSLVREVGFVSVFGFKYSPRPYTPALKLGDDVPEAVKESRLAQLFEVSEALQRAHLAGLRGHRARVLVEGPSPKHPTRFMGRSERHEIVHVESVGGLDLTGYLLDVEITEANKHSLVGRPVEPLPARAAPRFVPPPATGPRRRTLRLPLAPA
jgi:tRNA-2-methylthio-N6-dimethylallyladenosine synthase